MSETVTKTDLKNILEALGVGVNNMFVVETRTVSITFNNANYAGGAASIAKTGYTPIGIVGFQGAANTVVYRPTRLRVDPTNSTINYTVVNQSNSSETSTQTMTLEVLYKKDSFKIGTNEATRFTLTPNSKISWSIAYGYYDPVGKTVRIYFVFRATSTVSTSDTLFTIPEAYRPSDNYGGIGVYTVSGAQSFYSCRAGSDGAITQQLSNSVSAGMGMVEYNVA